MPCRANGRHPGREIYPREKWHPKYTFRPAHRHNMPRKKEMSQKIQVILPDDQIEWLQDRIESGDAETMSQAIRLVIRKEMRKNEDE